MRRAEGPLVDQRRLRGQLAGHRIDARDVQRLIQAQPRQNRRQQARLPCICAAGTGVFALRYSFQKCREGDILLVPIRVCPAVKTVVSLRVPRIGATSIASNDPRATDEP